MNRYGQAITWAAIAAPHLFTGQCTGYTYRDATTRQPIDDEAGDYMAIAEHSRKAELNFDAKVTVESVDFLNLSAGAAITVEGIDTGVVLASRAVETWRLLQPKTVSIQATHYPDMVDASPTAAGKNLTAFTPTQTALSIVTPGSKIIYSTVGFSHASGVVHGLTLEQILTITEDEPSPDGKLLGAAAHGYMRTIQLDLLATGAKVALGSTLAITGAPAHAGGYKVESCEERFADKRGKMYAVSAVWIPPFGSGSGS